MPTPEHAPTDAVIEKILPEMLNLVRVGGWTEGNLTKAGEGAGLAQIELARALPKGISSLVEAYFKRSLAMVSLELSEMDLGEMRIRDKVTSGVRIWFEALSEDHTASVKALDWITARPTGPLPPLELLWSVADAIWTGIGDDSTGFTYMSKRTTLSAVIGSTLAVWRQSEDALWSEFLDRRIADVMAFEKFKAGLRFPLPA